MKSEIMLASALFLRKEMLKRSKIFIIYSMALFLMACGESSENCDTGITGFLMGDLNDDSSIDVLDVVLMVNIILGS